jgi:serine-type D-Ala-D-Ala carboxypeptidase/endopeptidase
VRAVVTTAPNEAHSQLLHRAVAVLGRRHVGAVTGILAIANGSPLIIGTGSLRAANGPAPTADSTFEIGSITKTFTALVLAQAVVTGRLSLETPVRDILPASTAVPSRDGFEITVEQLARHTSGLPHSPERLGLRAIWAASMRGEDPYAPISTPVLLEQLSRTRLRRTPGKGRIRYSNFGAAVLGVALTRVYGKATYREMLEDVVLKPLGLTATTTEGETDAEGHAFRRRPAPNWHLDGLAAAGALRSTARDLMSYLRAQLQPEQTPLAEAIRLTHALLKPKARMTIGLGWMRSLSRAGPMFWHNGGTGGFRSFAGFLPDGYATVLLVNDKLNPDRAAVRLLGNLRPSQHSRG